MSSSCTEKTWKIGEHSAAAKAYTKPAQEHLVPGMGTVDIIGCVGDCKGARKGVSKVIKASEENWCTSLKPQEKCFWPPKYQYKVTEDHE